MDPGSRPRSGRCRPPGRTCTRRTARRRRRAPARPRSPPAGRSARRRRGPGRRGRDRRGPAGPRPRPGRRRPAGTPVRRARSRARSRAAAHGAPVGLRVARPRVVEQRHPHAHVGRQVVGPAAQHVAVLQQGGQQARQPRMPVVGGRADDHAGQPRVQRQLDHLPAERRWGDRRCRGRRARPAAASSVAASSRAGRAAGRGRRVARSVPHTASSRASPARSALAISGSANGRRAACSSFDHRRYGHARPGATGAAGALVGRGLGGGTGLEPGEPGAGVERGRAGQPPSTTTRTPSTVRLVSAMSVASTTWRRPGGAGASAASCSPAGRAPYSGWTSTSGRPTAASAQVECVGYRAGSRRRPAGTTEHVALGLGPPARRPHGGPTTAGFEARRRGRRGQPTGTSTGNGRPALARHDRCPGAGVAAEQRRHPARRRAWPTSRGGAGRAAGAGGRRGPGPGRGRPAGCARGTRRRSTSPTPSSDGSRCSRRVRMPSVTTSIRVAGPTRPVVAGAVADGVADLLRRAAPPSAGPRPGWPAGGVRASRCAGPPSHGSSSSASGTTVVLPAPGGAWSTARPGPGQRRARSSGRQSRTGRVTGRGRTGPGRIPGGPRRVGQRPAEPGEVGAEVAPRARRGPGPPASGSSPPGTRTPRRRRRSSSPISWVRANAVRRSGSSSGEQLLGQHPVVEADVDGDPDLGPGRRAAGSGAGAGRWPARRRRPSGGRSTAATSGRWPRPGTRAGP